MRRLHQFGLVALVAGVVLGAVGGWFIRDTMAEAQEGAAALAQTQLARFYDALSNKAPLEPVLGDAFQIMRTDGTRIDRAGYIARHPNYTSYALSDIQAFEAGGVLTASYFAAVNGQVEDFGVTSVNGEPRLATFTKSGDDWKLQTVANLGLGLATDPLAEGEKAVAGWIAAVASGDPEKVRAVITPEFQLVRSEGAAYGAEEYVASELPMFPSPPKADNLVVTGYGDYLVTRYTVPTGPIVAAGEEQPHGMRLTVFRKREGQWLVVGHANLAAFVK